MSKKLTKEEILARFRLKHGNKYDYSLIEYKSFHEKVKIICPIHGEFEQYAGSHFTNGCYRCGHTRGTLLRSLSQDLFLKRAVLIHKGFYDYEKSIYVKSNTKIIVKCPLHGEFEILPHGHLGGGGCQRCAVITRNLACEGIANTLSENLPCTFYTLKLNNEDEEFYKIGISRNLKQRHRTIKTYYNVERIFESEDSLLNCINIEQDLKAEFSQYRYLPKIKFGGYTECFSINPILSYYKYKENYEIPEKSEYW